MFSRAFFLVLGLSALTTMTACSNAARLRQEERTKVSTSSGMYCDFVNGDDHQDIEVELNLQMAKRCDANKNFSLASYKNASEVHGLVYCCSLARKEDARKDIPAALKPTPEAKAPDAPSVPDVKLPAPPPVKAAVKAKPAPKKPAPKKPAPGEAEDPDSAIEE